MTKLGPAAPAVVARSRWVSAVLFAGLFITSVDHTIVASALPSINTGLHTRLNSAGWVITAYGLCTVVAMPLAASLCGRVGPRRVFVAGVACFTVASLLCGLSTNIYLLVGWRAVQALGGGAVLPAAAGLVGALSDRSLRERTVSMFGVVSAAGQLAGPLFGGVLVDLASWRWVFFVNIPIGVALVVLCLARVPHAPQAGSAAINVTGLLLLTASIVGILLAVTNLGDRSRSLLSPQVICPGVPGVLALLAFGHHEATRENPFINRRLLVGRTFRAMNAINLLHGVVTFGVMSLVPYFAEQRYGIGAAAAGSLLTFRAIGMLVAGWIATMLLRRTGYRKPMWLGFALVGVGAAMISAAPPPWLGAPLPFVWLVAGLLTSGSGLGILNPAASNAGVDLAPAEIAEITGLRFMFINIGVTLSVSVTTAYISRSHSPIVAQQHVFVAAAVIVAVALLPLVSRIPVRRRTDGAPVGPVGSSVGAAQQPDRCLPG